MARPYPGYPDTGFPYLRRPYPAEMVKEKLLRVNSMHIGYVFDCLKQNTTYVRNIKKYLLASLFNAPSTIGSYYSALVNHDMYGDGLRGR